MSKLLKMLALGLIAVMLLSSGVAALAEEELTSTIPEQSSEQSKSEPTEKKETPPQENETPTPKSEAPAPQGEADTQQSETPAPQSETPAPQSETSAPQADASGNTDSEPVQETENTQPSPQPETDASLNTDAPSAQAEDPKPDSTEVSNTVGTSANDSSEPVIEGTANETEANVEKEDIKISPEADSEGPKMGTVRIKASTTSPKPGEEVKLTSHLSGFEDDVELSFQWQLDRSNGQGWKSIPNANQKSYTFLFSEEAINYRWRLIVSA